MSSLSMKVGRTTSREVTPAAARSASGSTGRPATSATAARTAPSTESAGSAAAWPELLERAALQATLLKMQLCSIFELNFAIFWRARSRLYQNEILQNVFDSIFPVCKMCTLLHRSKLNILAKNRIEKSTILVKIQRKSNILQIMLQNLQNFAQKYYFKNVS